MQTEKIPVSTERHRRSKEPSTITSDMALGTPKGALALRGYPFLGGTDAGAAAEGTPVLEQ